MLLKTGIGCFGRLADWDENQSRVTINININIYTNREFKKTKT
jgi:hypothetical protein